MTSRSFDGKVVVITGAGSGIGRQTAFAFADRGARLALSDVNQEGLTRTALLCRLMGADVHERVTDVSSADAMKNLADEVHARFGVVDVLVNNAGVGIGGRFVDSDLATIGWAQSINVQGVVHGCHFFIPKMIERGRGGHVVNIASVAGLVATKDMPVYTMTKFAVFGLSESLRLELAEHRIGVTTICPGVVHTAITRTARYVGTQKPGIADQVTMLYKKRGYGPERVAEIIVDSVLRNRGLVPVTPESWVLWYANRIAPRLLGRALQKASVL